MEVAFVVDGRAGDQMIAAARDPTPSCHVNLIYSSNVHGST